MISEKEDNSEAIEKTEQVRCICVKVRHPRKHMTRIISSSDDCEIDCSNDVIEAEHFLLEYFKFAPVFLSRRQQELLPKLKYVII